MESQGKDTKTKFCDRWGLFPMELRILIRLPGYEVSPLENPTLRPTGRVRVVLEEGEILDKRPT